VPYVPPPAKATSIAFSEAGNWTASTFYARYAFYYAPSGERRLVTAAAGYTSGGSYGTTDTNNTVNAGPAIATLNTLYAGLGASFKQAVATSGDTVSLAMPLQSNGIRIPTNMSITDLEIDMDYPPVGGSCSWRFSRWRPGDPSETLIGTVTVADGKRSGLNGGGASLSTGISLQAEDRILVRNLTSNGATFPGEGITAYVSFNGTFAAAPNPTAASGLSASSQVGSVALTWTPGTNSTGSLIYRDGIPYQLVGGAATSFVDLGPAGTGLTTGESHTYAVAAVSPGGMSALTGGVTGIALATYTYFPTGTGTLVSLLPSDFSVTLGTNPNAAATLASNVLTYTSGNVGANAQQDRIQVQWTKVSGTHKTYVRQWKMALRQHQRPGRHVLVGGGVHQLCHQPAQLPAARVLAYRLPLRHEGPRREQRWLPEPYGDRLERCHQDGGERNHLVA
jgi:hypothetical protein